MTRIRLFDMEFLYCSIVRTWYLELQSTKSLVRVKVSTLRKMERSFNDSMYLYPTQVLFSVV